MVGMPEMTPVMAEAVVGFLRETLPRAGDVAGPGGGWGNLAMTALEIGCSALVALGQAEETPWGAAPKPAPSLPLVLPLWEDIAVAVLWLAHQQNLIGYRQMDGSLPARRTGGFVVTRIGAPPPPLPNIGPGLGSGPALAEPVVRQVLEALGLVQDARWTAAAEVVHWRGSGGAWGLGFEADARFLVAVEKAVTTLPAERRSEMDGLMWVTEAQVAEGVARSVAAAGEARIRWGPQARIGAPATPEQVRAGLPMTRENDLNWIFFRHWRLGRGWLDEDQARRALEIFHDRVAIAMRRAVVARLYPGGFVWE